MLQMRRLLVVSVLYACGITDPDLPSGAVRFHPPSVYRQWWAQTEQCSGLSGDLRDVTWYRVPGADDFLLPDGRLATGNWDDAGNSIVLADESQLSGDLVRHEMLHALLRSSSHPRSIFIGRCGGTVVCHGDCITDGGAAPQANPGAVVVTPDALQVGVEIVPSAPGSTVNDGHFALFVTVENTRTTPVIAKLPNSEVNGLGVGFGYRIVGTSRIVTFESVAASAEMTMFAPREVKRFIFDFRVSAGTTRYELSPGTYRFEGSYGRNVTANSPTVTISP